VRRAVVEDQALTDRGEELKKTASDRLDMERRKLHDVELQQLCASPEIIRNSGWEVHVECTLNEEHTLRVFIEGEYVDGEQGGSDRRLQKTAKLGAWWFVLVIESYQQGEGTNWFVDVCHRDDEGIENAYIIVPGTLQGRDHFGNATTGDGIILK